MGWDPRNWLAGRSTSIPNRMSGKTVLGRDVHRFLVSEVLVGEGVHVWWPFFILLVNLKERSSADTKGNRSWVTLLMTMTVLFHWALNMCQASVKELYRNDIECSQQTMKWLQFLLLFYEWVNGGTEKLNDLPKLIHLVNTGDRLISHWELLTSTTRVWCLLKLERKF